MSESMVMILTVGVIGFIAVIPAYIFDSRRRKYYNQYLSKFRK